MSGARKVPGEIWRLASSSRAADRDEAVRRLKNLKLTVREYLGILRLLSRSDSEYVRRTAVKAVPTLLHNDHDIIAFSREALHDDSWQVREAGANILRNLRELNSEAMALIKSYSMDPAPIINRTIVEMALIESYAKSESVARRTAAFSEKD